MTLVLLADVALILLVARLAGRAFARVGQPAVVGEILAGFALGPSLLGLLSPGLPTALFPDDVRPALKHVADLGLVLFMFGVGRESDPAVLRDDGRRIGTLAAGSIVVPALVGAVVALPLWASHAGVDGRMVPQAAYVAFVAVALSVTAFPVLARILDEAGLLRDPVGATAMAVAAVTDLAAWTALAVVVAIYGVGGPSVPVLVAGTVGLVAVLALVVRPALRRLLAGRGRAAGVVLLLPALLLCAWATDALGLHAAIGAFAFGLVVPRTGVAAATTEAASAVLARAGWLLVPVFFLTTGLSTDLSSVAGSGLVELLVLLVAATAAKFVGVAGAARVVGMAPRPAAALGTLMNARGLTELVLLQVGRSAGILDEETFAALVGVALLTTLATGPVFRRLHRGPAGPRLHGKAVDLARFRESADRGPLRSPIDGGTPPGRDRTLPGSAHETGETGGASLGSRR